MIFIPDLFSSYVKGQEAAIEANWSDLKNFDAVSKTMRENALGDAMHEGNLADAGVANIVSTSKYDAADANRQGIANIYNDLLGYNLDKQAYGIDAGRGQLGIDQARLPDDLGVYAGGKTVSNQAALYNQGNVVPNLMDDQALREANVGANTAAANTSTIASNNAATQIPVEQAWLDRQRQTAIQQQGEGNRLAYEQEIRNAQNAIDAKRAEIQQNEAYIGNAAAAGGPNADRMVRIAEQKRQLLVQDLYKLQQALVAIQNRGAVPLL